MNNIWEQTHAKQLNEPLHVHRLIKLVVNEQYMLYTKQYSILSHSHARDGVVSSSRGS